MKKINKTYIVDDDPIVLVITTKVLSKHPRFDKSKTFKNGKAFLKKLKEDIKRKQPPSLTFLDLNMPVMDGWELLTELENIPEAQKIPVVILTSSIDRKDKIKSREYLNVRAFVSKPLTSKKLNELLNSL